jgi:hypothetical protein
MARDCGPTLTAQAQVIGAATVVMTEIHWAGAQWEVTVFIARPYGEPPIRAGDVEVQLFDADGPARLASAPSDEWVEAGGAAGTTASASFRFEANDGLPTLLRITWGEAAVEAPVWAVTD